MSFNGSGTFLINTAGQPVVSGTVISSTAFNALTADLATGLSTAITKDGQTTVTANIPMSTYKFTGLGVGSAATDSANLSQVQSTVTKLLNSVSGADTITATASPTLAAYAAGQMFYFVAAGDNTTSVTLNIDSLGAKAVTRDGSTALVAADIKSGEVIVVVYDGTRFQVVSQLNSAGDARFANVSIASSLYVGGVSTFVGNAGFSANVSIASALSVGGVAAITGATTIGGNLTLSGGTANGVLYLNGSKVATSGSALAFDSSDRLIVGAGSAVFGSRIECVANTSGDGLRIRGRVSDGTGIVSFGANAAATEFARIQSDNTSALIFGTGAAGSEAMRLTSTGLGIGTASPTEKLHVAGALRVTGSQTTAGTGVYLDQTSGTGGVSVYGPDNSTQGTFRIYTATANGGTGSTKLTLDSSGSLGLGVTPSAWSSTLVKAIQIADNGCSVSSFTTGNTSSKILNFNNNAYYDAGGWKYVASSVATSRYELTNGEQRWYTAPSGTAGNAISFTQAMTLDASGNLLVGTTSALTSASGRGNVTINGTDAVLAFGNSNSSAGYVYAASTNLEISAASTRYINFLTNNTERARLTSGGDLLVGVTSGGSHTIKKAVAVGNAVLEVVGNNLGAVIYNADGGTPNAGNAVLKVWSVGATGRSINAAGTINASGADYAEYMTKASDFVIAKGDVCGIDANGKLTNVYADAISFVVKSTNPSYVGNDGWGGNYENDAEGLETARQKVDRIAFAGQVPVNVLGATPGQYIVPINDNGAIKGAAVSNPTFEQYQSAVGKVIAVQDDGRALIIVKVA